MCIRDRYYALVSSLLPQVGKSSRWLFDTPGKAMALAGQLDGVASEEIKAMIHQIYSGSKGGWVTVKDAVKKAALDGVPYPAALRTATDVAAKQETKEENSEPVAEPVVSEETPTNGGEE